MTATHHFFEKAFKRAAKDYKKFSGKTLTESKKILYEAATNENFDGRNSVQNAETITARFRDSFAKGIYLLVLKGTANNQITSSNFDRVNLMSFELYPQILKKYYEKFPDCPHEDLLECSFEYIHKIDVLIMKESVFQDVKSQENIVKIALQCGIKSATWASFKGEIFSFDFERLI